MSKSAGRRSGKDISVVKQAIENQIGQIINFTGDYPKLEKLTPEQEKMALEIIDTAEYGFDCAIYGDDYAEKNYQRKQQKRYEEKLKEEQEKFNQFVETGEIVKKEE